MRSMGSSGIWELFVPGVESTASATSTRSARRPGDVQLRADPVAFATEMPPETASVVHQPAYEWGDDAWLEQRARRRRRTRGR